MLTPSVFREKEGSLPNMNCTRLDYELFFVLPTEVRSKDYRAILSNEVPEALGSTNDSMCERFGHSAARNIKLEAAEHNIEEDPPPVMPFHEAFPDWVLEEEVQKDGDYGYLKSGDTVENEPQDIIRLRHRDEKLYNAGETDTIRNTSSVLTVPIKFRSRLSVGLNFVKNKTPNNK
ncbi:unnamed protein product [Orchesella dallaii]|uniref:Uncharacterized protein n=1 Tax=Orchesella dallaii TaxID=48710 RepID=A0ABP1Q861_9HEXA